MAPLIPKTTIGRDGTKRDTPKGVLSRLSRYHPPPYMAGQFGVNVPCCPVCPAGKGAGYEPNSPPEPPRP